MVKDRQTCTGNCGKEKNLTDFYASSSPFHSQTGKMHVCKQCVWDHVQGKNDNIDLVKDTLRMLDKPYLVDLWQSSIQEAEKANKDIFKIYIKNLGMRQNRELTWKDSDSQKQDGNIITSEFANEQESISQEDVEYMMKFWGRGFDISSYIWLQNEFEDFVNRYECDSKGMELLIKQICLTQLDIEKRRENNEKVDAQLKTLQDLLGSSNLKPVQETGANAVEQESFGTLIKKFEREKPIPEPDPIWKDVDGIGKYIRTFFLGHMSRAIGVENKFQDEYDEELSKHTVAQEDIDDGDE